LEYAKGDAGRFLGRGLRCALHIDELVVSEDATGDRFEGKKPSSIALETLPAPLRRDLFGLSTLDFILRLAIANPDEEQWKPTLVLEGERGGRKRK